MFVSEKSLPLGLALGITMLLLACGDPTPGNHEVEDHPHLRVAYPSIVDIEDVPSFMAHRLLVERHWQVNPKRVHRLWKREHIHVPRKQQRRRHPARSESN